MRGGFFRSKGTTAMSTATRNAPPPTVSADEIARALGVHVSTVWRWGRDGQLPKPIRIGNTIRWPRRVLDEMIQGPAERDGR